MSRKSKCRDEYVAWLLSQRGTVSPDIDLDDDRVEINIDVQQLTENADNREAQERLQHPLIREREASRILEQDPESAQTVSNRNARVGSLQSAGRSKKPAAARRTSRGRNRA